ncbi:MAG: acylphosphatase [Thaumarchaeota archaeon]|nr:acylphosphatase [Nitrososphaerota archaeon]
MSMPRISVRVLVSGKVQGVSFRASMMDEAQKRRVDGWVRNTGDGSVEALLQGDEAAVKRVIEWARLGPPRATVSTLTEERLNSHPHQVGFRIIE